MNCGAPRKGKFQARKEKFQSDMASFNSVTLVGNVGGDPNVRQIGENKVAEFSLATSQRLKDGETTDWHRIVAWSPRAEIIEQYVTKGSRLLVRGSIRYREYTTQGGEKRYITEIVAQEVVLLSSKQEDGQRVPSGQPQQRTAQIFPEKQAAPAPAPQRTPTYQKAAAMTPPPQPQPQPARAQAPLFDEEGNLNPEPQGKSDDLPF